MSSSSSYHDASIASIDYSIDTSRDRLANVTAPPTSTNSPGFQSFYHRVGRPIMGNLSQILSSSLSHPISRQAHDKLRSLRNFGTPSTGGASEPVQAAAPPAPVVQVAGPDTSLETIEAVGAKKSSGLTAGATFNPRTEDNIAAAPFGDDATPHGKVTPTSSLFAVGGDIISTASSLPASLPRLVPAMDDPSALMGEVSKPFVKRFPNATGYDPSVGVSSGGALFSVTPIREPPDASPRPSTGDMHESVISPILRRPDASAEYTPSSANTLVGKSVALKSTPNFKSPKTFGKRDLTDTMNVDDPAELISVDANALRELLQINDSLSQVNAALLARLKSSEEARDDRDAADVHQRVREDPVGTTVVEDVSSMNANAADEHAPIAATTVGISGNPVTLRCPVSTPVKHLTTPSCRADVTVNRASTCHQLPLRDVDVSQASQAERIKLLAARVKELEMEQKELELATRLRNLEAEKEQRDAKASATVPLPATAVDVDDANEGGEVDYEDNARDDSFLVGDQGALSPSRQTKGVAVDGAAAPVKKVFGFSGGDSSFNELLPARRRLGLAASGNVAGSNVLFRHKKGGVLTFLTSAETDRMYGDHITGNVPLRIDDSVGVQYPKGERKSSTQVGYSEEKYFLTKGLRIRIGTHSYAVTANEEKGNFSDGISDIDAVTRRAELLKDLVLAGQSRDYISCIYTVPAFLSDAFKTHYTDLELKAIHPAELVDPEAEPYYLPDDYGHVPVEAVVLWQRMLSVYNVKIHKEDCRSSALCYLFIVNSVTSDLMRELDAVMLASGFTGTEKGGVTLLLVLLRTIFATPQSRIDSFRAEVIKFGREGYKTTSGESVLKRNKLLRSVLKVLHQCNVGTPDMITTVIIGLTRCSVKTFSEHFAVKYREELRKKAAVQRSLRKRTNTAGLDQDAIFRALFDILDEAENLYEALCADNEWVNGCGKDLTYMKASTETIIDESDQQSTTESEADDDLDDDEDMDDDAVSESGTVSSQCDQLVVPSRDQHGNVTASTPALTSADHPRMTTAAIRAHNITMQKLVDQVKYGGDNELTRAALAAMAELQQNFAQHFA